MDNPNILWETHRFSTARMRPDRDLRKRGIMEPPSNSILTRLNVALSTIHRRYYYSYLFYLSLSFRKASREVPM